LDEYVPNTKRLSDFPVFSGRYSTYAYLDETVSAVEGMLERIDMSAGTYYQSVFALFFHRPYHHMPISAMSFLYVRGLARSEHHHDELIALCEAAGVSPDELKAEAISAPDLYSRVLEGKSEEDPYPQTSKAAGALRRQPDFCKLLDQKMGLGGELVKDLGNLYSAALPAWIAAGFEEACQADLPLTGASMVMVGYGSGDAAESIPMTPVPGWQVAASKIHFAEALSGALDLKQGQYEALHDGTTKGENAFAPSGEFAILRVGDTYEASFQDLGVEYYGFVEPAAE
jgi:hydroxymethylglutaryl-CoA synthase